MANEQLQNFFNQHIFKTELEEYRREGIDGSQISYVDNQALLVSDNRPSVRALARPIYACLSVFHNCLQDMFFQKPLGMFALLDEESHFPKATQESLVQKFHSNLNKCQSYKPPRGNAPVFTLCHYAGDVEYTADEFLEKNRDK